MFAQNGWSTLGQSGPFSASVFKSTVKPILDPFQTHLGPFLAPDWAHLGPIKGSLNLLGPILGFFRAHWALLGPSWAHFRLTWALLGHLGVIRPATWVSIGALFGHLVTNEVALDYVIVALGHLP